MPSGIYKRTEKTKINLRLSHLGQKAWNKGKKMPQSTRDKIKKLNALGLIGMKNKKHSLETRLKISKACLGEKRWNWKGGVTPLHITIRNSLEMKLWRAAVLKRDNYQCVLCKAKTYKGLGKRVPLHADHIKSFAEYPELRFDINNGRTLCVECHMKTPSWGPNIKKNGKNNSSL